MVSRSPGSPKEKTNSIILGSENLSLTESETRHFRSIREREKKYSTMEPFCFKEWRLARLQMLRGVSSQWGIATLSKILG